jgi:thioredoxin reductase (NADPH)
MNSGISLALYFSPMLLILIWYLRRRGEQHQQSVAVLEESLEAGLMEPASLHPVIDPNLCIGCGSCIAACPEMPAHKVIGMVRRKAELVSPTDCIGHGACGTACPVDAITLVFGTETRGVDIPNIKPNFETNVPGIFIAGELGGMGLIRNAIEQGRQAMESVAKLVGTGGGDGLDVLIVGAGPAGFSASLAAKERGLRYRTIEQESLGGTVAHFPRGKLVMTSPATLPLVGKVKFTETTKEKLLGFWQRVEEKTNVGINYKERLESVEPNGSGFHLTTTEGNYTAKALLLTIGRRGTPRKLGVPGEELSKVAYRLMDPEQYQGKHVLVVGGGDSALEAGWSIAEVDGTTVTLSYRSGAFSRAKKKNREKIAAAEAAGRVKIMMNSNVVGITADSVGIETEGNIEKIANDAVIISAGGILPTGFLKEIGIAVETKFGTQ